MAEKITWENNLLGFIPPKDWLEIPFRVNRPNDPVDRLFGDMKTDNLIAQWQSIAAEYQIPVMAQFHGFDTEAQTTFRVPIDNHNIEKGLIKVKINQSERMRALLRNGVTHDEALYDYVVNDGVRLAEQVITRTKVAKNELLATGQITIHENNLDLTVDYGLQSYQTGLTLDISTNADIAAQIQAGLDAARQAGVVLTGFVTSSKVLTKMRRNIQLQKMINGNIGAGALVRQADFNAFMAEEFGLTQIIVNDLTYGVTGSLDPSTGRPSITTRRYYPQNKITFFAANPGGNLGVGLWGDPPEVDVARLLAGAPSNVSPYVYVSQWQENDPAVLWTKASSLFMPVLYNPASLWIADVTADDDGELDAITVTSAAGSASGTTSITISDYTPGAEESYVYKTDSASAPVIAYHQTPDYSWTPWNGVSAISATTGHKITIASINAEGKAVAAGSATVTAKA